MNESRHCTQKDYEDAILVQDAVNLSGVVFAFSTVIQKICNECDDFSLNTTWKNTHPICVLYADKIADLSIRGHRSNTNFINAYSLCKERSKMDDALLHTSHFFEMAKSVVKSPTEEERT